MPPSQRQPRAPKTQLKLSQRPPAAPKTYSETIEAARSQAEAYTNDVFWHRIHDSRGAVRSEYQFREGDYGTAIKTLEKLLRSLGLWDVLNNVTPLSDASEKEKEEREILEAWAINHTMPFICDSILDRWTLERPIHGSELLEFLEKTACKPFRLLDLPTELREHVYNHWDWTTPTFQSVPDVRNELCYYLDENDYYNTKRSLRTVIMGRQYSYWQPRDRPANETRPYVRMHRDLFPRPEDYVCLPLVSREFQDAAVEREYGRSTFKIKIDNSGLCRLFDWVERVGMNKLRHVRKMKVRMDYHKGCWDVLKIRYHPVHGLKAEFHKYDDWTPEPVNPLVGYTSMISRRAIKDGRNSTGVIDFLVADPDALRIACWGPYYVSGAAEGYYDEDNGCWQGVEGPRINERNAYEVAYGRIETNCPW